MKRFFLMLLLVAFLGIFLGCSVPDSDFATGNGKNRDKTTMGPFKMDRSSKIQTQMHRTHLKNQRFRTSSDLEVETVVYVEVNDNDLRNAGAYVKASDNTPFFDIAIIFAANINYDFRNRKAVFFANSNVRHTLKNKAQYIEPLQKKGIKVLLSILGNHQGAGIANFPNREAARDFAQQLADVVAKYNLDGIDFDDEWSEYGRYGTGQPNEYSFVMLLQELRALLPNKIISFFKCGPASHHLEWNGKKAGEYLNYSYYPYYPGYNSNFSVHGMRKAHLSASAVQFQHTSVETAVMNAQRTMRDGYGVYMMYDLANADETDYISAISEELYHTHVTREILY